MTHRIKIFYEIIKRDSFFALVLAGYIFSLWSWLPTEDIASAMSYEMGDNYYFRPVLAERLFNYLNSFEKSHYALLVVHIFIPAAILVISFSVFRRFVGVRWAAFLALVGLSFLDDYPFRAFLYDLMFLVQPQPLAINPPVVTSAPFPSFTVLFALIAFSLCSVQRFIGLGRACVCSLSVAVVFYIHALTAGLLICFWFTYYFIRAWRQSKSIRRGIAAIGLQTILLGLMVWSAIAGADFNSTTVAENTVTLYFAIVYWFIPVFLALAVHIVQRIDLREWFVRFMPIFVIMSIEFLVILLDLLGLFATNFDFLYTGFSQFFLHALYYVPVINILGRPPQDYHQGLEANFVSKKIAKTLTRSFGICEKLVLPPLIFSLLLYQNNWFLISIFQ